MMNDIATIQGLTTEDEVLTNLAEEATELAKAALKLRRTLIDDNPTPIQHAAAYDSLVEECADVSLCLQVLGVDNSMNRLKIQQIKYAKALRWIKRLRVIRKE